ncbi:MAG: MnmC family methyltransferase [Limnothrix sp.]
MTQLKPQITADGSFTFFSEEFQEHFHSHAGAKREATEKFLIPCRIAEQAQAKSKIRLLDICYGLGHNTAAALTEIWRVNPDCEIELFALEKNLAIATDSIQQNLLSPWSPTVAAILGQLSQDLTFSSEHLTAHLLIGDARQTIQQAIAQNFKADAIFLDPFSPPKCPQLWTIEFINLVAQCLAEQGYLATYSCAAAVRQAMAKANLKFGATPSVGRKSPGTLARFIPDDLQPLSLKEIEHLQTRAAIPYRDENLKGDRQTILDRRIAEQTETTLESTSQWKKRWQNY